MRIENRNRAWTLVLSARYIAFTVGFLISFEGLADAPQPGWVVDSKSGCRLWNPSPQPNESVTWSGGCENGFTEGHGIEQWYSNGKIGNRLEGDSHQGMIAHASVTYPNGDTYVGDLNGNRNGYGIFTSVNGTRYEGNWRDGRRNGHGIVSNQVGDRYDGEFRDDLKDGHGVLTKSNGDRYEGDFRNGKANGHGVLTSTKGYSFDGNVLDEKANGYGVYTWKNGARYNGEVTVHTPQVRRLVGLPGLADGEALLWPT